MSQITSDFRRAALRRGVLIKPSRVYTVDDKIKFAASIELANYGFLITPDMLQGMSVSGLTSLIEDAKSITGADRDMTPIYPGFPKQVQGLSTTVLLVEQIIHYLSAGQLLPDYPDVLREGLPLEDMFRVARTVEVKTAGAAAREIISELVSKQTAMSPDEVTLVSGAVRVSTLTDEDLIQIFSSSPNGENRHHFTSAVVSSGGDRNEVAKIAVKASRNADQVLRAVLDTAGEPVDGREADYLAVVDNLSNSKATAVKFRSLSRPTRRVIVSKLGDLAFKDFRADTLVTRSTLWRRVMRMVHPFDITTKGTSARRAVDIIHGNIEYITLNSLIEGAMERKDVKTVVDLTVEYQPGNLLRRLVALLRLVKNQTDVRYILAALNPGVVRSPLSTLISTYDGVIAANFDGVRVVQAGGDTNSMVSRTGAKIKDSYIRSVSQALLDLISIRLEEKEAPTSAVSVISSAPVPLIRRDLARTDRVMERGERISLDGDGNTLRVYSHWRNTQNSSGYIDLGVILMDANFKVVSVVTWNTWNRCRAWSTYSGDKCVYPGHSAAEYFDVDLTKVRKLFPGVRWAAVTLQSWSGFPVSKVDLIAGAMLRSKPDSGEVFDPRSVVSAFQPTTSAYQSTPLVVDLEANELVWLDSSSGSTATNISARDDHDVADVVKDGILRPRMTVGELLELWAKAHGVETVDTPADIGQVHNLLA